MRTLFITLLLSLGMIPQQTSAQVTVGEAAYLLGRQQVLAQQITRAYLAIELKVEVQSYKLLLTDGINLFNSNLKKLENMSFSNEVSKGIDEMAETWDDYYKELTDAPQKEEVIELVKQSYEVLKKADAALEKIEAYATAKNDMTVDLNSLKMMKLAGYQNAISQHAVLYYMAYWNTVKVEDFFGFFNQLLSEYETNFAEISEGTDALPEIHKQMMNLVYVWGDTKKIISNLKGELKKDELRKVLTSADALFRDSNDLAKSFKKMVDVAVANSGQ
jgi:hypothetical protein